ncbi:uncharacterized protein A1O9_02116 [Exophiala aquamarina CBS 119918]|uniref:Xylanolytic transcriptional activator regulatory domain-containing protein n=1 Tax=Exophiala aquamarina CBS 119918 TaxID=1182545 RepID=A0A072PY58_9EURO|nr:uncharacterized protein A1O9_02116 [Exophiala aquamarina CBS 119918]KEF60555.1 hypothetical protein A1O9_02116 [Exophiala aquamarina CBS 119918]
MPSESETINADRSVYIIKHMGRLVYDESGTGRFAGSTTGVHFVLGAQETSIQDLNYGGHFPQSCYSLHLLQPTINQAVSLGSDFNLTTGSSNSVLLVQDIKPFFSFPLNYYMRHVDIFMAKWESFCPVLVRREIVSAMQSLLNNLYASSTLAKIDCSTVMTMLMVTSINQIDQNFSSASEGEAVETRKSCLDLACQLLGQVSAIGDLQALQALSLFAFYVQITGHSIWLLQLNSLMVRISQSLGLHRHDRRFKFKSGMVELRRRIWWWVYLFDKITSIVHGLPRLINDTDVDNEMPTDCILDDVNAEHISYPLPGENTPVFLFNQYVSLGQKLSTVLEQLYTTTQRRGGAEKIRRLDREMRVWNHTFNALPRIDAFEVGEDGSHLLDRTSVHNASELTMLWLQLLANISMVLIHRPALTFSVQVPEFGKSLNSCVKSSTAILNILDHEWFGGWLRSICPSGPSLIFQSGLMHIYSACLTTKAGEPDQVTNMRAVAKAIALLQLYLPGNQNPSSVQYNPGDLRSQWIGDAVSTLRSLEIALLARSQSSPTMGRLDIMVGADLPSVSHATQVDNIQPALATLDTWNTNALESLNNFNNFDWIWGDMTNCT